MTFVWTPEITGHLCRRYRDGALFHEIGMEIGCTKSAAIGKFNRLRRDGEPLAVQAAQARAARPMDTVAEWMAAYGGNVAECARALGISYEAAKGAWSRVRAELGSQAR